MSRAIISRERIDCDICGERDIGEPEITAVNGIACDICYDCCDGFKRSVTFLIAICGLEINYLPGKES